MSTERTSWHGQRPPEEDHIVAQAWRERDQYREGWLLRGRQMNEDAVQHRAEVERLRQGLLACAAAAGEDVSDGIPSWPDVVEWAVRAVRECRETDEEEAERLRDGIRDLQRKFEARKPLHTSDFTRVLLALDEGGE